MWDTFSSKEDMLRCQNTLSLLAQHTNTTLVLTGSIAFYWHLVQNNICNEQFSFNDVDVVIEDSSILKQSLSKHCLVSHYHPLRAKGKILLQLVDKLQRVRIDIFTPYSPSLMGRSISIELCGRKFRVIS